MLTKPLETCLLFFPLVRWPEAQGGPWGHKCFLFLLIFTRVYLIYNVVLVSVYRKVSQLYLHIYPLLRRFFSHIGHYTVLSRVPVLHSRSLLVIFFFWPHHAACGIFIPWSGIKPMFTALGVWSLHHWTTGEVPSYWFLHMVVGVCQSQSPSLSRHHFPSGNHKFTTTFSYPLRVQMQLTTFWPVPGLP